VRSDLERHVVGIILDHGPGGSQQSDGVDLELR